MTSRFCLLMAASAAVGALLASEAQAGTSLIPPFNPSDFFVNEAPGQYTLVNNSDDWYIWSFSVTNPQANHGSAPTTTQPQWTASVCGSCFGNAVAFQYTNSLGAGFGGLSTDVGPHSSSNKFFFGAPLASDYSISITNGQFTNTVTGQARTAAPEPSSWALMIAGFGSLGAMMRRRRARIALA